MCNLYNLTTSQEAIRQWTRALRDILGNLELSIDIYPNQPEPVVRNAPEWGNVSLLGCFGGCPTPPERVNGMADYGTTNVRQTNYFHWQQYLGVEHRCLVIGESRQLRSSSRPGRPCRVPCSNLGMGTGDGLCEPSAMGGMLPFVSS